jgi:hypothetical protein
MKKSTFSRLHAIALLGLATLVRADTHNVYFGTDGPGAEGI